MTRPQIILLVTLFSWAAWLSPVIAQPPVSDPTIETAGQLTSVTVYPDLASVTRTITLSVSPGTHRVRVSGLPASILADSARATISNGAAVHAVHLEDRLDEAGWMAELTSLTEQVQAVGDEVASIEAALEVLGKREVLYDSVAERVAREQADAVGTGTLNLDEITRMADYLAEQHAKLLPERRRLDATLTDARQRLEDLESRVAHLRDRGPLIEKTGLVDIELLTGEADESLELQFTYLVNGATWRPSYNLRAERVSYRATLEFDGMVTQQTGEDWTDVTLILSTAPAMIATRPPTLKPWYLDVVEEGQRGRHENIFDLAFGVSDDAETRADDVPIASYEAIHRANIPSGNDEAPEHLVRLATIRDRTSMKHVAAPLIAENAFLRGRFRNSSRYHLPPGRAFVFFENDYVGETMIPYVAPGGSMEVYFGVDPRVEVRRITRERRTRTTGLLGDGTETTVRYRIIIDNQSGREITMELWDRAPASNDDRVKVAVTELSDALSGNRVYRRKQREKGLLRWDLRVEAIGTGHAKGPREVDYTIVVSHHRDIEPTDLPE